MRCRTSLGVSQATSTASLLARGVGGFKKKREAKAAEAEALRRIRDGVYVEPSRLTVGAYLTEMWLPSMASKIRATTLGGYRHNVRAYLVPRLGDIPPQRLTTARVGAFYGELVTSGGKGVVAAFAQDGALRPHDAPPGACDAVADGLVIRNVAAQARPPPRPPGRHAHLDSRAGRGSFSRRPVRTGCIPPGSCWPH